MGGWRLRSAVAVVALGVVLALVLSAAGAGGSAKAFGAGTTLTIISGDVSVRHGASAFVAASDGEVLSEGDAIRTGPEGRAILTYFEGSTVTIEPATELAIDAANTSADGGTVVLMTQAVGRTWHVVTKLITGGSKYEVRTPASTASVRGTEFQVDTDDAATTVTTTEGTVLAHVLDSAQGVVTDVPVTPGTTQTQPRNAPPALARTAPEPERKVTVTVDATNTLVVDPLGRANGVTKDGKVVVQTPGAQVKRDGDRIVVTLPNLPDGKLAAQVEKKDAADDRDVDVVTKVEEKGHTTVIDGKAVAQTGQDKKSAGVELKRTGDGTTEGRTLDESEKQSLPAGKTASPQLAPQSAPPPAPTATLRATEPTQRTVTASPAATRASVSTRTPDATPASQRSPSATDATRPQGEARTAAPRTSEPTTRPAATSRSDANTLPTAKGDPARTDAIATTAASGTTASAAATTAAVTTAATTESSAQASSTSRASDAPARIDSNARAGDAPSRAADTAPKEQTPRVEVFVNKSPANLPSIPRPAPNAPPQPVVRSDPTPRADERKPVDTRPERPKAETPNAKAAHGR